MTDLFGNIRDFEAVDISIEDRNLARAFFLSLLDRFCARIKIDDIN